jgi:hypothetical protein
MRRVRFLNRGDIPMSDPIIRLPERTFHGRRVIDHCKWTIKKFVEFDAYAEYDHYGSNIYQNSNFIRDSQRYAMNSAMRARSSVEAWSHFTEKPLPELDDIPPDLDLIDSPQAEIDRGMISFERLIRRITARKWLTDMAASKLLYLLRPRFVAISDSYMRHCLGISDASLSAGRTKSDRCAARMVAVQRGVRKLGNDNLESLNKIYDYANSLKPLGPPAVNSAAN